MANMSYCRFQNTLLDLSECLNALRFEGTSTIKSAEEREAAAQLYALAAKFREVYEEAQEEADQETQDRLDDLMSDA